MKEDKRAYIEWLTIVVLILVIVAIGWWFFSAKVKAEEGHKHPAGWDYGLECCSLRDCAPARGKVDATELGWFIEENGETIPYKDYRLRRSRDEYFHVCQYAVGARRTLCLYVPDQSY